MATVPKTAANEAAVVLALCPNSVLVGDRLGAFWPDKAAALGRLMAHDGQITPIMVRKSGPRAAAPWTLVAGHHRLEGARIEGLATIDAIEIAGGPEELLKIEAAENVARASRSPLERASFVRAIADAAEARLKEQHGDLSPQQIGIRKRWDAMRAKAPGIERDDVLNDAEAEYSVANFAALYGWQESTAQAMGLSKRTVRDDLALHRALIAPFPDSWRDLATHPAIGENASALREIASIADVDMRGELIESLTTWPEVTLAQAMEGLGLSKPSGPAAVGATKFQNGVLSNLDRLTPEQQRSIAISIADKIKPSALLDMIDALTARAKAQGVSR